MISLLTSLKPFKGAAVRIQDNALGNWRRLDPTVEIILYGEGEGIVERASRFGARHVPDIRGNAKGIPDFSAIAEHATLNAKYDVQVYLNGDILLPPNFIHQLRKVSLRQYLIVGQRIDLDQESIFNQLAHDWNTEISRCALAGKMQLHNPSGQDYFVFPRGLWKDLVPLIIGRGAYDNALVAYCLRKNIPIIDATWSIHVVHQWHDYSHVKGVSETFGGVDALANKCRHDIEHSNPDIEDAGWRLIKDKLIPSNGSPNLFRRLEVVLRYRWELKHLSYLCRAITRIAWVGGWLKPRKLLLESVIQSES